MNTVRRTILFTALLASALGGAACSAKVDEASESTGTLAAKPDEPTGNAARSMYTLHTTPTESTAALAPVVRPSATLSAPRDGRCVEDSDATGICSLASGRSHFYSCAVGGAPPRPLPECKGVGGSTHWCCF
jgi:hypothetical protein